MFSREARLAAASTRTPGSGGLFTGGLAYNLKRMIAIMGVGPLIQAMQA
jgi:hypothetical protein